MNVLSKTILDIKKAAKSGEFNYLITRFDSNATQVSDLDILVDKKDFTKVINNLKKLGYREFSHDWALGGRIPGAQINLVKPDRVKIDLHKDFTWRAQRYIDLKLVWENKRLVDEFLVFINVLFEKTYFDQDDYRHVWQYKVQIFNNALFENQAKKYNWHETFQSFKYWHPTGTILPLFIPVRIVLLSFLEKFHLISFLYYIFFKIRYLFKKTLPYD